MRCRQYKSVFVQQFVKDRLGQSRALGRVRAGTELVQQHQTVLVQMLPCLGQMVDLGREGGNIVV